MLPYVETLMHFIFQDSLRNRKFKVQQLFKNKSFVTFDLFNASLTLC